MMDDDWWSMMMMIMMMMLMMMMMIFIRFFFTRYNDDDDDDDDGERKDDDTDQPKGSDAGLFCAGIGDAVSTQKEPKDGYRKKEAKGSTPGRREKASSGDPGDTEIKEGKSSTEWKVKPE